MKKKHVAVLMGGWSSEREVSLSSGAGVIKALEELGHSVTPIDVKGSLPDLVAHLVSAKLDVIFNDAEYCFLFCVFDDQCEI